MENVSRPVDHLMGTAYRLVDQIFGRFFHRRPSLTPRQKEQERALQPLPEPWAGDNRWYRDDLPPRAHNTLHPLIHGGEYFADLCMALAQAQKRVTIAGWSLTPLMALERGERIGSIVADLLDEVSSRAEVYVLLWSGAPTMFRPSIRDTEEVRRTVLAKAPRVRCELDRQATFSHDHHQKAVTVDGRVAYVGGIDLSTFQGDRWDTADHHLRFGPNWHDVQMRMQGEVVGDVEENFCQRWNAVTGEHLVPLDTKVDPSWNTPAQIVRTVPAGFYPFAPEGKYGIRHALLAAIREAQHFIYLENQYIWDPEVVAELCAAMDRPRSGPFRIVLVLPARAYSGKYDNDEHVRSLREADRGRGIFEAYSLYSAGPAYGITGYRYLPIYVHAKVNIVDDTWLMVGSANLNKRGLATDTEMDVQAVAPDVARILRVRLWAEHLGMSEEEVAAAEPIDLIDNAWKVAAQRMKECFSRGEAPPPGNLYRYDLGSNPGSRVLDLMQDITLEH